MKVTGTTVKQALPAISFYLIAATAVSILEKLSPSGPCTPGLGVLCFMLLLVLCIILFLVNIISFYKGDYTKKVSLIIHTTALVLFILYMSIS